LLKVAFDHLNLHRVYAKVSFNDTIGVNRLFRLGFKSEGFLREDHFTAGCYHDSHLMGLLLGEYRRG
jgi:diamine N-acetyltransferase